METIETFIFFFWVIKEEFFFSFVLILQKKNVEIMVQLSSFDGAFCEFFGSFALWVLHI